MHTDSYTKYTSGVQERSEEVKEKEQIAVEMMRGKAILREKEVRQQVQEELKELEKREIEQVEELIQRRWRRERTEK